MFAGAGSRITAFEDAVIHINVRVDDRQSLPVEVITRNIADSWRMEEELKHATRYLARIYKTGTPASLCLGLSQTIHYQS
jgi:hypothetical protein